MKKMLLLGMVLLVLVSESVLAICKNKEHAKPNAIGAKSYPCMARTRAFYENAGEKVERYYAADNTCMRCGCSSSEHNDASSVIAPVAAE